MTVQATFASIQVALLALAGSLVMLSAGGEFLVAGATKLARSLGMTSLLIGLTVVAFGTSTPELFVGLIALFQDHADIMVGNVVGSNIANIGLILGLSALLAPLAVAFRTVSTELYLVLASSLTLFIIAWQGMFVRLVGVIFVAVLLLYTYLAYRLAARRKNRNADCGCSHNEINQEVTDHGVKLPSHGKPRHGKQLQGAVDARQRPMSYTSVCEQADNKADAVPCDCLRQEAKRSYPYILFLMVCGFLLLAVGSEFFITAAVDVARYLGVNDLIIGLTLAAVGTSLPELASCLAALRHRQTDLLVGNIIGSNLFNILMVLGCGAIARPFSLSPNLLTRDLPVMFAFSAALIPILAVGHKLTRLHGLLFLAAYGAYIIILI
jgi:cation:H+ antiporter